jgi:hypothetical protein
MTQHPLQSIEHLSMYAVYTSKNHLYKIANPAVITVLTLNNLAGSRIF